ncbi:DUF5916 domain-containing protein [Anaeromyxobacter paludicola]|uniref:Carbohydrate binding family 9 domain-containing protein n=1 Tax=Anaeromyxobacter paludicola TaxID=2918171 RepID=A0ABM7XCL9_9BACT|nr:DUF5916 domain-containing protein [Anaeromyxobacter paludicola]BDG09616.1 hypothetical protein AMPC_27290 [Anaeromyxobacter paludicola]
MRPLALALWVTLPHLAMAQEAALRPSGRLEAVRREGPIRLDGRLDDAAWRAAVPYASFVQLFPDQGRPPSRRTEVRVLYDDDDLWVGIRCSDPDAPRLARPLGRRDAPPYSDSVAVTIDSARDRRTGYQFAITVAGVQSDGLFYDDDSFTGDWDAVWEGAASVDAEGWSAELRIPLGALRFDAAQAQTWGFGVRREIARTHEVDGSVLIARNARGYVSRLGRLTGLEGLRPRADVELAPYLATRLTLRPQYADLSRPRPRLLDPEADVGLDLRATLGRGLVLNGALNPDFGQVEADQVVLNLSNYETFFPEKRPFFLQGTDVFQPVGTSGPDRIPQQLFYSRRVGIDAPILGAAKVTGQLSREVRVGLLEALVTGPGQPEGYDESRPDRGLGWSPSRPLHFGPADARPLVAPAARNFLVGALRWQASRLASVGATATSVLPLAPACTAAEAALDLPGRPARCDARAGHAAALDFDLRSASAEWAAFGQLDGSVSEGGPPALLLRDGTALRAGDAGAGGYVTAGKLGGEPWRFSLHYDHATPRLDLNAAGYQRTQNEQLLRGTLSYVRPTGGGAFHGWELHAAASAAFTTDGRRLDRGNGLSLGGSVQLRSYVGLWCDAGLDDPRWDVREIAQAGVPYRRPMSLWLQCGGSSDPAAIVAVDGGGGAGLTLPAGPLASTSYYGASVNVTWRPTSRLETRLGVTAERNRYRARFVEDAVGGLYTFGDLDSPDVSVTLREQLVLTPRLTLQLYAQVFTDYGRYGPFYQARSADHGAIRPEDLRPVAAGALATDPDYRDTTLNVNLVLRWEWRLGSTFYAVYSRSQTELPTPGGVRVSTTLGPRGLAIGPTTDVFLLKLAYWWRQ